MRATLAVASLLVSLPAAAADPTKQQCVAADDAAQDLRPQGKLQAAREQLLICTSPSCPKLVREDCAQRLEELNAAMAVKGDEDTARSTSSGAQPPGAQPAVASEAASTPPEGSTQRTIGMITGGAGVLAAVVGTVLGVMAKSTYDQASQGCRDGGPCSALDASHASDAHSQATLSTGAFVAAGLLLGGGLALYVTAPKGGAPVSATVQAVGTGLRLEARW